MTSAQGLMLVVLAGTIGMFLWGRWRHDMVALAALLACVSTGLVPAGAAFAGFGHPAVITVACVLVLSRGLQTSGAVDLLAQRMLPATASRSLTIASLCLLVAALSAFMNNVGALALLMPVALQIAAKRELPPGRLLMPLAFASILGGMTTLIGTPPNLIVAAFRAENGGDASFGMFDFTPVGLVVALSGIAFITLLGWRLVPERRQAGAEGFEIGAYLTEARIPEKAKAVGMTLGEIERALVEADVQVIGLVRGEVRMPAPRPRWRVRGGDILQLEAEPEALAAALTTLGLRLEEATEEPEAGEAKPAEAAPSARGLGKPEATDDIVLLELAVLPASPLAGRSATDIRLRTRFGINLLAVSRRGERTYSRLRSLPLQPGDVLLMQGAAESVAEFASEFACVPLAERPLHLPVRRRMFLACGIMVASLGMAAAGLFPPAVAFAAGVLAAMATRVVPPRAVYTAIDWPVIVLLGALIPVAEAMAATGTAELLALAALDALPSGNLTLALALILVATMTVSDVVNNAATAAMMCPIALSTANSLGVSADPFLMAVAVGASCAFLTPIGHQNNTLILGPGGFQFGDYWRLGLPLELLVVAIGVPMILWVWPL